MVDALSEDGEFFLFDHNAFSPAARLVMALGAEAKGAKPVSAPQMRHLLTLGGATQLTTEYISFFPKGLTMLLPLEPKLTWQHLYSTIMVT